MHVLLAYSVKYFTGTWEYFYLIIAHFVGDWEKEFWYEAYGKFAELVLHFFSRSVNTLYLNFAID